MRKLLCLIGIHGWVGNRFNGLLVPLNGDRAGHTFQCTHCRKVKWRQHP